MTNIWVGTDWHLWCREHDARHPYRSISNLGRLSDHYIQDIQVGDLFIHLGDLCDPDVADPKQLKSIITSIPGYKVLCKGNHDTEDDAYYLSMGFDVVCDVCTIHNLAFSHKPLKVPPDWINVHGHLHTEKISGLGSNYINAFDTNYSDRPVLVEDLLAKAPYQNEEQFSKLNLTYIETSIQKYINMEDEVYKNIVDLTDRVALVPLMEAAGNTFDLIEVNEIQTPDKLSRWMKSNVHYSNFTKLKSQAEIIKSKSGSCHDQVSFAYPYLKRMDVNPKVLFIIAYREGSTTGGMTHSLLYWEDSGNVYWFENAWKGMEGIHKFNSLDELKAEIKELYDNMPASKSHPELEFRKTSIRHFTTGITLGQLVNAVLGSDSLTESWNIEYGEPDGKLPIYFTESLPNEQFIIDRVTEFAELLRSPIQYLKVIIVDQDKFYREYTDNPFIFGTYDEVGDYVILIKPDQVPPEISYSDLAVHECCHAVLYKTNPNVSEELAEGLCISWAFAHYEQLVNLGNRLQEPRYYQDYTDMVKKIRCLRDKFSDIVYYYLANNINMNLLMQEAIISEQADTPLDEVLFQDVEDTKYFLADDDTDNEIIDESKSELDNNFVPKDHISIASLKKVHITEAIINKYKKEYPVLKHVRCKDTKEYKCDGYMWLNNDDELVCHVGSCEYLDDHTKWIVSLEVLPKYKGHGISTQILDFAVKTMGCKYLSVNKNNKLAKHIYDKYGFKTYQDDKSMYYMTLESSVVTESVLDLDEDQYVFKLHIKRPKPIVETTDYQEPDRATRRRTMEKYGLKTPGQSHEYTYDDKPETEAEKRRRERQEERDKALKKARRIKKRKAFVQKLKSKLPGVKNESVDVEHYDPNDIWADHEHFFEHPDRFAEVTESYKFELDENVKFIDTITESAQDDKLYPVYVMLMHSGTALATAIKTVTQSNYSHSSISFDSSMRNMYSFGRKEDLNPFIGGFKKEDIRSKFFQDREIPYALYVVPCTKSEIDAMKKRLDYFVRNKSKFKYDFTGLFKNYFGIADNPEYKWFCSRFVADILNAGRPSSDPYVVEPSLMKPEDFANTTYASYVCGGMLSMYDQSYTDKRTKAILRIEAMNRSIEKQLQTQNESVIYDLDPMNPFIETTLEYQLTVMDESVIPDFMMYLKSFKVRFDPAGNIIITRREVDKLDQHFRQSVHMVKAYKKAGNIEGVKEELTKVHFMIEMINTYYLNPKVMQSNRVKADLKKEMLDLRSVMLNMFQQNLMWITTREPRFNFQTYYDGSKYGKETYVPKTILSALGKMVITALT